MRPVFILVAALAGIALLLSLGVEWRRISHGGEAASEQSDEKTELGPM